MKKIEITLNDNGEVEGSLQGVDINEVALMVGSWLHGLTVSASSKYPSEEAVLRQVLAMSVLESMGISVDRLIGKLADAELVEDKE